MKLAIIRLFPYHKGNLVLIATTMDLASIKKILLVSLSCIVFILPLSIFAWPSVDDLQWILQPTENTNNFNGLLEESIDPIKDRLDSTPVGIRYGGVDWVVIFVIDLFKTYIFPLVIILAALTALFGLMEIMTSDAENNRKKWTDYLTWGVVGIIIFISAEFIFNGLYSVITTLAGAWSNGPTWNVYAEQIYNTIAYPFIKLAMYLLMAWLFIILLVKSIQFVSNPSEKAAEQGKNIIISAAMGIIIISIAKTLVEAVYDKQWNITWLSAWTNGSVFVGWGILNADAQTYQTIFNIINYFLWLIAFFILCIIIYQAYLMLFNDNTDESVKKMRKNLLYIFWWLLLIWLSYLIVNLVALDI